MDVGAIVIYVAHGQPNIVRCETAGEGTRLIPATNTAAFDAELRRVLDTQGVTLDVDGLYPCPVHLKEVAEFPSLTLPNDLISLAAARDILYPDVSTKTGWARVHTDVEKGRLRAYRIGLDVKRLVSRAQVMQLAALQASASPEHAVV